MITRRLRELDLLGDGLPLLNLLIPWERFRPILESVPKAKPKGPGGRKPYDRMLLFKMMVLQQLHNLSDEQTEYQVRDRLSFQRFLGLGLEEAVPDNTTLWLFRESLAQAKLTERLFTAFHAFLREAGYAARAGQIIDASFVTVPRQRMHRKERSCKRGRVGCWTIPLRSIAIMALLPKMETGLWRGQKHNYQRVRGWRIT